VEVPLGTFALLGAMQFSVIIPTLGRSQLLLETLASIAMCDPVPDEVVVVDGNPDRSAEELVRELDEQNEGLRFLHVSSLRGASVQRNRGMERASGDVVVFIDDDAVVAPDLFARLADAFSDPHLVGATGRIVQKRYRAFGNQQSSVRRLFNAGGRQGTMTRYGYPRHVQDLDSGHDVEFMQGCLMSARREDALAVGFDQALGGERGAALLEDEDFSYRLSRRGRVCYFPDAVVHHKAAGFRARDMRYYSRLIVVDRAYLLRKNFRVTPLVALQFGLLIAVLLAHRVVNREWRGALGVADGALAAIAELRSPPPGRQLAAAGPALEPALAPGARSYGGRGDVGKALSSRSQ
jgi:GT2 family glycosyltransferase